MTYTLKIWFKAKHDDYNVFEISKQADPVKWIQSLVRKGGFWAGDRWIPLHRIGTVERIAEQP